MKTLSQLISGAEQQANSMGEEKAGAQHYVLSSLQLVDGSAARVFKVLGITEKTYHQAVDTQYKDALAAVGIDDSTVEKDVIETGSGPVQVQPSGQEFMKSLYTYKKNNKDRPILGVHVLAVVAKLQHGVAVRAFKVLGVSSELLSKADERELGNFPNEFPL